jgi:hypothetical protein
MTSKRRPPVLNFEHALDSWTPGREREMALSLHWRGGSLTRTVAVPAPTPTTSAE